MTRRFAVMLAVLIALGASLQARQNPAPTVPGRPAAPAPAAPAPPAAAPIVPPNDDWAAQQTREQLRQVLDQYPPSVRQVLRLDPSLLSRAEYLMTYPALWTFLQQHPVVLHNPSYFIGDASGAYIDDRPPDRSVEAIRAWGDFFELFPVALIVFIITTALVGLIRTLIDQRRWTRATRLQMEMQNKLVDRFGASTELLAYLQSPTGRELVSVYAPANAAPAPRVEVPVARIFWPLQAGIVVAAGGLGLLIVGSRLSLDEVARPIWGIGILALAVGAGLVVSAATSFFLSQKLGLLAPPKRTDFGQEVPTP
jgi:hypothetical protein